MPRLLKFAEFKHACTYICLGMNHPRCFPVVHLRLFPFERNPAVLPYPALWPHRSVHVYETWTSGEAPESKADSVRSSSNVSYYDQSAVLRSIHTMRLCQIVTFVTLCLWGCCVNSENAYRTYSLRLRQIIYFDASVNKLTMCMVQNVWSLSLHCRLGGHWRVDIQDERVPIQDVGYAFKL